MKLIPLTRNQIAIVDDGDFDWLSKHTWCAYRHVKSGKYYAHTSIHRKATPMHRMILDLKRGDGRACDHINGNGLDNRRSNLRLATQAENCRNTKLRKNNTSGYRGVSLCRHRPFGKWIARIGINGTVKTLGYFDRIEDAIKVRNAAAIALHGEFARLNVIPT